ncbi:MAG TPA: Rieske (2Fe-2S) protein [Kiritimatiellia bacterium]|nr:Rieske (2Fe-2S) protein [Kiritimatiellia bacterium]
MNARSETGAAIDRRAFLKLAGGALGALALGQALPALGVEPDWTDVGGEADFPENQPVFLKDRLAFVVRRPDGLHGLSARCTHRGCTVAWSENAFVCPCHQARFDVAGSVLAGPARDPLPEMPAKAENGRVWLGL